MRKSNPEFEHQRSFSNFMAMCNPKILWTASAGGEMVGIQTRIKAHQAGYKKGCPDIMVFEPRGPYCGLFIELKAPLVQTIDPGTGKLKTIHEKGRVTNEQADFLADLHERGYRATICWGSHEAVEEVSKYLELGKHKKKGE